MLFSKAHLCTIVLVEATTETVLQFLTEGFAPQRQSSVMAVTTFRGYITNLLVLTGSLSDRFAMVDIHIDTKAVAIDSQGHTQVTRLERVNDLDMDKSLAKGQKPKRKDLRSTSLSSCSTEIEKGGI
jgi:hypothetical protein